MFDRERLGLSPRRGLWMFDSQSAKNHNANGIRCTRPYMYTDWGPYIVQEPGVTIWVEVL
jgi:hypothetical protein